LTTLYIDYVGRKDVGQLFKLYDNLWMLKYGSFILLILFATNVILHYRDNRRNERAKAQLNQELDTLKARLFDLQEGKK
jgi:ABC-type nickel/cobalt efflux system permease component RcnA